jgi:hypothetical protein
VDNLLEKGLCAHRGERTVRPSHVSTSRSEAIERLRRSDLNIRESAAQVEQSEVKIPFCVKRRSGAMTARASVLMPSVSGTALANGDSDRLGQVECKM